MLGVLAFAIVLCLEFAVLGHVTWPLATLVATFVKVAAEYAQSLAGQR